MKMAWIHSVIFLILQYSVLTICEFRFPDCDPNKLNNCNNTKQLECNASTKKCECAEGYDYHPESADLVNACILRVAPSDNIEDNSSHTVSIVVVIFLTMLLLGSGMFFIVRRYNLLHWVHNKIFSNRNAGATYEDVMIGQDDPPITA